MSTDASALPRRRLGVDADHEHYKWWALSCTSLGMLLATINSGTLIIALPDLERALGTSLLTLVWVILAYMIASTVLVLTFGPASATCSAASAPTSRGFVVFAAGLARRGLRRRRHRADPLADRAGHRRRASCSPTPRALVTDAFPREQLGVAMGTNTMVAAVGLVLGPVLGGALVAISWHWVFWFNVPLALAGSRCGARSSCASWPPRRRRAASTCSAR